MSGVFMDGGGHDHMGHGIPMGHAQQPVHYHHDHGAFAPDNSADGGFLQNLLGFNQHHGHSFLSHLLGLDQHDQPGHMQHGQAPSQTPIWTMALQSLKMDNLFHGINITINFWLLVMFLSFISWLFILYWIRHHEPFADAVLGTGAAHSATTDCDRQMIEHCRGAIPWQTGKNSGINSLYVPIPRNQQGAWAPQNSAPAQAMSQSQPAGSFSSSAGEPLTTPPSNGLFGSPSVLPAWQGTASQVPQIGSGSSFPIASPSQYPTASQMQFQPQFQGQSVNSPLPSGSSLTSNQPLALYPSQPSGGPMFVSSRDGSRLKLMVSR